MISYSLECREGLKTHRDGTVPKNGEIFVFGSNLAGRHGAGAALAAYNHFGAKHGKGIGLQGQSYAIPTKDEVLRTMLLMSVKHHVTTFLAYAKSHPNTQFFITRIGCGLAGFKDADIAPMFAPMLKNCNYPESWALYLTGRSV